MPRGRIQRGGHTPQMQQRHTRQQIKSQPQSPPQASPARGSQTPTAPTTPASAQSPHTNRVLVTISTMLGIALAALDTTIVGTAMPSIIGQLGGIALYSWVFTIYLLASTATVPLFGKLADIFGRKPVFLAGAGIFVLGSALCGLAQGIEQLIIFRGIQGIGAGAVMPVTLTIIGDLYPGEQRAKMQGLFSAIWGISGVAGPAVGGFFVETVGWRWVFLINLPVGIAACAMLWWSLRERIATRQRSIDYLGSISITLGVTALLFALQQGGTAYPWTSAPILLCLAGSAALLALFVWQERRFAEPMLPFELFRNRIISASSLATAMGGIVLFGVTSYVPLFLQGVQGRGAFTAGTILIPMSVAWPVAATFSGRLLFRFGYRAVALLGMGCIVLGTAMLLMLREGVSDTLVTISMTFVGVGMGFSTSAFTISVQNSVDWSQRGIATGLNQFCRTFGGAIGVAVMGGFLNASLGAVGGVSEGEPTSARAGVANALLDPALRAALPMDQLFQLTTTLDRALHVVFVLTLLAAVVGLGAAFLFPGGRPEPVGESRRPEMRPSRAASAD